jgi:predicted nucleic acid-binding protein
MTPAERLGVGAALWEAGDCLQRAADAWIAATAALYGAPLITHNANDYRGLAELKPITENP